MVDAALLELEGVLFDTRELRRMSLHDALIDHGLASTVDREQIDGYTPRDAALAALTRQGVEHDEVLIDLVALGAERAFASRLALTGAALREGAVDFVREAAAVARLGVVTRARRADADTLLRLASLTEFFTIVITADDVLDAKPSGEGYLLAIERLARQRPVVANAILAIEDGTPGIRAARAAGLRCVAIGPLAAHVAIEADGYAPTLNGQTLRALEQLTLTRPGQERVQ